MMSDSNEKYQAKNNARLAPAGLPGKHGHLSIEKPKNSRLVIIRLWRYLSRQRALLFLVLFLLLINIGSTLLGSYLLRPIINNYIIPRNIPGLISMILLLAGIYIIGAITGIYLNRLMIVIAQKTISAIRTDVFSKLQILPLKFFDSTSHGELMSRFTNDMDNVSDALNTSILQLFTSAITLTGIFTLMVYISPLLTVVTLIVVPFMLWVASAIIKKARVFLPTSK